MVKVTTIVSLIGPDPYFIIEIYICEPLFLIIEKIALQTNVYEESIMTQVQGSIILPKVIIVIYDS